MDSAWRINHVGREGVGIRAGAAVRGPENRRAEERNPERARREEPAANVDNDRRDNLTPGHSG